MPVKRSNSRVRCILSFPGSTETRWLDKPPSPGLRLRDDGGHGYAAQVWIVNQVLQSGQSTYTVILSARPNTWRRSGMDLVSNQIWVPSSWSWFVVRKQLLPSCGASGSTAATLPRDPTSNRVDASYQRLARCCVA